jgi:hypothetical protein
MNRQEKLKEVLEGVKEVVEALYEEGSDSRAILQYMDKMIGEQMHGTLYRLDSLKTSQISEE